MMMVSPVKVWSSERLGDRCGYFERGDARRESGDLPPERNDQIEHLVLVRCHWAVPFNSRDGV
jgi:hypothetical protein